MNAILGGLWSIVKTIGFGLLIFAFAFTLIMIVIAVIGRISLYRKRKDSMSVTEVFNETSEYKIRIYEIIRLLTNHDEEIERRLVLMHQNKDVFMDTYLSDLGWNPEETGYWELMIHLLRVSGYLAYYDWKRTMDEVLSLMEPMLKRYSMETSRYDDIQEKTSIMEPTLSCHIAERLEDEYALVSIDTGEDSYALSIVPIKNAKKAVALVEGMPKPSYASMRIVK